MSDNGFSKLLGSRRFWISLLGMVFLGLQEVGLEFGAEFQEAVVTVVLALVGGYTLQDFGRALKGG